jgi:hypothetical protein
MALTRPNVIVFQEYQDLNVTPDVPDLNVLVVGPCYQILDYLDDKSDCYAGTYGSALNVNNVVPSATAVDIMTPPELEAGGVLKDDSVKIFLDDYRLAVKEVTDPAATTTLAKHWAGDNLFRSDTVTAVNMKTVGVEPGDTLIVKQDNSPVADLVMTVKELVYVLRSQTAAPNFTTCLVDTGDLIYITDDGAGTPRNGVYTVKKKYVENGSVVDLAIELESTGTENWVGTIASGTVVILDGVSRVQKYNSSTPISMGDECHLRTTTDFAAANNATAAYRLWRTERQFNDYEVPSGSVTVDAETKVVTVAAALTAPVTVNGAATTKRVTYAKVYMQYMALRQDLQRITDIETQSDLTTYLGKYDARNPLHVGVSIAKANTTTKIRAYGLLSDDLAGYQDFMDRISSDRDVYAIVPLTYDTTILGALKVMAESYADPTYCLDNGVKQKFRAIIGAVELETTTEVVAAMTSGTTSVQAGTAPATGDFTLTLTKSAGQTVDFTTAVLPGDTVSIKHVGGTATYTVAHVNSALVLEVSTALDTLVLDVASTFDVLVGTTAVERFTTVVNTGTGVTFSLANSTLDNYYNIISAPTADFSGVIPGDIIQIPTDPESDTWTTYDSWVVSLVESNTRLRIVNEGTDSPTVANELPHLTKRTAATDRTVTAGAVRFRVIRNMSKSEQVTNMLAIAQGFASKRMLLAYPSSVDVSGLIDGSLTRTTATIPVEANAQPGYYLSCCIGGQTAGNPSQQGFTNFAVNGISRIYNSSDYFTEEQLTDLSNGGIYVFVQDTNTSLPYTIHEVTTDVVSLETGEYMAVKNLDFISVTFLDTLRPFIGTWNINPDTIRYINGSCTATITSLKSRFRAKIGAPLISATIDSVAQSEISEDRIEAYIRVTQPMTLNVIGIHLVA